MSNMGGPLWFEEIMLLSLALIGLRAWAGYRPPAWLFLASVFAVLFATLMFLLQFIANADDESFELVFVVCASATLFVYALMLRRELTRLVVAVFPRAKIHRGRRGR
jgi:hypothetical protein